MATLLVVNHGTLSDRNDNNVLAILSKANENNGGVVLIDTPGFGSPAFNTRWARKDLYDQDWVPNKKQAKQWDKSEKKAKRSMVRAKSYMGTVASDWFKEEFKRATRDRHDVNGWSDINKVIFVGWSRGCITTWYQIFYLQKDNDFTSNRPKICIFNIDPCYGPSNTKSNITAAMNYIGPAAVLEEAYAVNESGVKSGIPGIFALYPYNQGVCTRYFLPGKHATGTIPDTTYGRDTMQLYTQRLRDFLTTNATGTILTGLPTTGGNRMDLYSRFKSSYMNKGGTKYRFNRAQRCDLWALNNAQKKTAGIDKTWFFMNQQEYDLYYPLPNLRRVLSKHGDPLLNDVKTDFNNLNRIYPFTADMIRRWIKRIPTSSSYGKYLKKYSGAIG